MSKLSSSTIFLAGVQWLFFMFANTVVIPLSVGSALQLPQEEIVSAMQRSFIFTGVACILQALIGHRYALMEGQSGLWWGVILSLGISGQAAGMDLATLGGGITTGILLSGVFTIILGYLGFVELLKRIMTPIVMSVFLILLACQLILSFFQGMIGLSDGGTIDLPVAGLSLVIALFVGWLNFKGRGLVSNLSLLIGIIVGWIAYVLFFPEQGGESTDASPLLTFFPWGTPNLEIGIVLAGVITGLMNTTNTITALKAAEPIYRETVSDQQYQRGFLVTGISSVVSGLFGLVPYASFASSVGFLQSTRIIERAPFIVGSILFILLGAVPSLSIFFSSMPISVGSAVLFVAYLQLFGAGLRYLEGIRFNPKTIYRVAVPVLVGLSLMSLPGDAFTTLPMLIRPLLSSGLLLGTLLSMVMENTIDWSKYEDK
jgi:xanthine/uracil permease